MFLKDIVLGKTVNGFLKRISKAAVESSYKVWLRGSEAWSPVGDQAVGFN